VGSKSLQGLTISIFLSLVNAFVPTLLDAATISGTYITTADVSLRSGPGMSYPVVETLAKGIKINVIDRQGYWLKVEPKHGGVPGYIDEQFAAPEGTAESSITNKGPSTGVYRTLVDVDLRQGPGATYPVVARLPSGIKVHVTRAEGDWLRIESKHGGKPGYLEKKFVERWTEN